MLFSTAITAPLIFLLSSIASAVQVTNWPSTYSCDAPPSYVKQSAYSTCYKFKGGALSYAVNVYQPSCYLYTYKSKTCGGTYVTRRKLNGNNSPPFECETLPYKLYSYKILC